MTLLALGINHKTAPVALRERVTFSPDTLDKALESLLAQPMVQGGVVLSTCNRTELYLSVEEQDNLQEALIRWLCDFHGLNEEDLRKSLYWHQDNDAVSHLMRVASGLDSLVLGEPQILGQVKKAFADSSRGHLNVSELERMFQKSFSVAKRVRTETDIGASAVSVAFAACTLARQIFESLSSVTVLLVGAGETIELVARHLREHNVRKMVIANRTRERAQALADEVGAEVIALSDIDERLKDADIIISSTASPLPIIGKGMVERALKARRNQPMLLVDIAVPRDVEPRVPHFIEKPDPQRVVFQRHKIHGSFTKRLNCQYYPRTTWATVGLYRDTIVYLHNSPPLVLSQCRTKPAFTQRSASATGVFIDRLYLKRPCQSRAR